jgi:hypothetical protein
MAAITLLVASIATIGAAPFSSQQPTRQQQSSSNTTTNSGSSLLDEQTQESDRRGRGGSSDFSLQVTERSNSLAVPISTSSTIHSVSVQCNSDETVIGGGFSSQPPGQLGGNPFPEVIESKKQDNGWFVRWLVPSTDRDSADDFIITVHAECLKIVPSAE